MSEEKTIEQHIDATLGIEPPKGEEKPAEAEDKGESAKPEETSSDDATEDKQEASEPDSEDLGDDTDEPEDQDEDKPRKPSRGVRKRFNKLTRERDEARRALEERDAMIRALMAEKTAPKPEPKPRENAPPKQEDYQDYGEFLAAHTSWVAEQKVQQLLGEERQKQAESQKKAKADAALSEARTNARKVFDAGREKYEDFDEVCGAEDLRVTEAMSQALMSSESGHEVLYHLGNNPDEAERIAGLSPVAQVRELTKLETTLAKPPAPESKPKTTSAPEPIKPVGGKSGPKAVNEDTMDIEDYMVKFNAGELPSQRPR